MPIRRFSTASLTATIAATAAAIALMTIAPPGRASTPLPVPQPRPTFSPERFFSGATVGSGVLRIVAHHRRAVHVVGTGRIGPDGTLVLSQRVLEGDKSPRMRQWTIRQTSPGRYDGTLSDAVGPVAGDVHGDTLRLRFRMTGGFRAEQRIVLQTDGRSVLNKLTVRKMGIRVAVLDETIQKLD